MRLTTVILIASLMQVSAATFGQRITLNQRNASLKLVLREIRKQSGYDILSDTKSVLKEQKVTVMIKDADLDEALSRTLQGLNLSYEIRDKIVTIKRKESPSFLDNLMASFATIDARGRILDESGKPLEGATVVLKGTNRTTKTDAKGEFLIANVPDDGVLVIRYVGYKQLEISLKDAVMPLEIKLNVATGELEEVNVTYSTGYQNIPKERATGSFAQPDKVLFEKRISTDIISRLEGITSGLLFNRNTNGNPGLEIRGISTINADAAPLIVVDNFPYDGDINNINPNDILSVNVLKDAAAASIWGARAGNGVIVITTTKGRYNQPLELKLTANLSLSEKPDLDYEREYMSSRDFITLERDLFFRNFYDANLNNIATFPVVSPVVSILAKQRANTITEDQANAQINALLDKDVRKDLEKYFYQSTIQQQYALNATTGNKYSNYFFSAGYDKNRSAIRRNENDRISINNYAAFKPISGLEITAGINYTQSRSNTNTILNITKGISRPYESLADANGNPLPVYRDFNNDFIRTRPASGFLNWEFYPLTERDLGEDSGNLSDIRLRAGAKYTILPGLDVEGIYQYSKGLNDNSRYDPAESYYARNLINRYAQFNGTAVTGFNIPIGGILQGSQSDYTAKNLRFQTTFNKTLKKHEIAFLAGIEQREINAKVTNDHNLYGYDPRNDAYQAVDYTRTYPLNPATGGSTGTIPDNFIIYHTTNRYRSFFANGSYSWNNLYVLSGSARIDQANLFGVKTNDKQVPLWSAGAKWNVSSAHFYGLDWLPKLQLRVTYGFSGNLLNNGTAYTTAQYFSNTSIYVPNSQYQIQSPGNPGLTWEKIRAINAGLDFSLKNDRIYGSIEWYHKRGSNLIGQANIPSSSGFNSVIINYGNMKGKGIDVVLNTRNLTTVLKWTSTILFSYTADKVTRYDANVAGANLAIVEGRPVNSIFVNRWAGLDPANGNPRGYDAAGNISTDYTALNQLLATDKKWAGRAAPGIYGGLRNTFSYKNFSASVNFSYKLNYYFIRNSINYNSLYINGIANVDYAKRWMKPGDENSTNVPSAPSGSPNSNRDNFYNRSEAVVEKGDHIRLQDIIISYEIGRENLKKVPFKYLQISLLAGNMGTIWKANRAGIDPDYSRASYVPPRTFSFGLKTHF